MHVAALWRYPVTSLGGELLQTAVLTADGVAGDRTVHVSDPGGPLTGRTRHALLTLPVDTGPDGAARVAGHRWSTPAARDLVRAAAGPDAGLAAYDGPERFDITNLLVATAARSRGSAPTSAGCAPTCCSPASPTTANPPGPAAHSRSVTR